MTTAIEQAAKREHVEQVATSEAAAAEITQAAIARASAASRPTPVAEAKRYADMHGVQPGLDPQDFVRDHRIHVKDGSLFVDPYLVLHPAELAPANDAKLREKLRLTYTVNNPSFYESPQRLMVALNFGQLVPASLAAKHSKLMEQVKQYNAQLQTGVDADLKKLGDTREHPFASILRDTMEKPTQDPVGIDLLKNGLAIYLLVREKLTQNGYYGNLTEYVSRAGTPDQVLGELAPKIGLNVKAVRDAAARGGVEAVGQLLALDQAYVADVKKMVDYAATQDFGFNVIEHWHLGRQLLGVGAPIEKKITTGLEARISGSIEKFRGAVRHAYEVPAPVKAEEKRVADALNLLEPIQRTLMHKLGYEICYTPEYLADDIAKYQGIYGLHRKAASDLRDIRGTYRIYFSGRGDLKGSMRTLVHEVAHNLWPEHFTPEEVQKIDAYVANDAKRFAALKRIMDEKFPEFDKFLRAYQAGSDAQKAAIAQTTQEYFAGYGISIDAGVLAHLRDANELRYLVAYANDTLTIEGARYAKSGYDSPAERFREVLSRFAEIKQVELSGNPQLVQFLAPGLNQVWEAHYIPHLNRVYQHVVASEQGAKDAIAKAQQTTRHKDEAVDIAAAPLEGQKPETPRPPVPKPEAAEALVADMSQPSTSVDAGSISSTLRNLINPNAGVCATRA